MTNWQPEVDEIERRKQLAYRMGGEARVADQHTRGKLTVRERIAALLDAESFREHGVLAGSAEYDGANLTDFRPANFITGRGLIEGRPVVVGGGDITARARPGGGGRARSKGDYADEMALGLKVPMIRLIDGFGADVRAVASIGRTYLPANDHWLTYCLLLSEVPVVAVALGAVAGLPAAQMGVAHFALMVKGIAQIFAAGPPVVERALGLTVSKEELGGVEVHVHKSGLVDNAAEDEADAFRQVRAFLSYLPTSVWELRRCSRATTPWSDARRRCSASSHATASARTTCAGWWN